MSASAVTGGGQANQFVTPSLDPSHESGSAGRDIYTISVPDMDTTVSPGIQSIDAGATVTVIFPIGAGFTNPTESGSYDFTISKETTGVMATFTTPLTLHISDTADHRDTPITVWGKGFKNGTVATTYLDRSRDANGNIVNVPDGIRTPGIDVDLLFTYVGSDDTFTETYNVAVTPFAVEGPNQINVIDGDSPPNHYNGMGGQTPVTFTIEPLLSIPTSLVTLGNEVELTLVDWPATDRVMDHVTADSQGVDQVMQSSVTIAGIPQQITSGDGQVGSDNEHTFRILVGTAVPTGVQQLKVKTYTSGQTMSDAPAGASDTGSIVIQDEIPLGDTPPEPNSAAGDRAGLVALFNATDGENWTNTTNWLTDAPLDEWYGVSVGGLPRRVTGLYLGRNHLSGQMPAELGNFTSLTRLNLSENRFSGTIPEELGSLTNLWYLNLSENRFSGDINAELGGLSSLRELYLYENQLTGMIPAQLGSLANLEYLDLGRKQLTGPAPSDLGRLTNLGVLSLGTNRLSGTIPTQLGSPTNLTHLSLNHNQLSGQIPEELGNLTNLTGLFLNGNQLTWEIPEELGNSTDLQTLDLRNNQLAGKIPAELGNLTNLQALDLSINQLSEQIPADLGDLTNLNKLSLNSNRLSGEIPDGLGALTNLATLNLGSNRLRGEIPAGLGNVTNLTELHVSFNQLSGTIPAGLGNFTNLKSLQLVGNLLSGKIPVELGSLTNLTGLYLHNNQLGGEIPADLGSLANLTNLLLGHNQLTGRIPVELGNLTNLVSLGLNDNQLSGDVPLELRNLSNLGSVYLSNNQLTGCVPAWLRGVPHNDFTELGLPFCEMPGPGSVAGDRAVLVALYDATDGANWGRGNSGWLTSGPISQWFGVTTDAEGRVSALHLQSNLLNGEIPSELGNLTELDLSENYELVGEIPAELGNLTNLTKLYLYGNRLSGEIPAELGNLTNLTRLLLGGNQLTGEIPSQLGNLTGLIELGLRWNRLTGMIPEELGNLTNLTDLELSPNRLTGCIPAGLRSAANSDLADLGIPFCDMLNGSPVSVIRFMPADAPVRIDSSITLEATLSEPVSGFTLDDVSVANGAASSFSGSGAVYAFDVTPNAIGEVTVDIAASAAEDA